MGILQMGVRTSIKFSHVTLSLLADKDKKKSLLYPTYPFE